MISQILVTMLSSFIILHAGSIALRRAFFGYGSGPIHMVHVSCTGSEATLLQCRHSAHYSSCGHHEDAGVKCIDMPSELIVHTIIIM